MIHINKFKKAIYGLIGISFFSFTVMALNIKNYEENNGLVVEINGNKKYVSAKDNYTIFYPELLFNINKDNYTDYYLKGYRFDDNPTTTNLNITYNKENKSLKIINNTNTTGYNVLYYIIPQLFNKTRNFFITYDINFSGNNNTGGIIIGDYIHIITSPTKIGFLDTNNYINNAFNKGEKNNIRIFVKNIAVNKYKVLIYLNNKLVNQEEYNIPNANWTNQKNIIGLIAPYTNGELDYSDFMLITLDTQKGQPYHSINISTYKEKYNIVFTGYWRNINTEGWGLQLVGCNNDYSMVPTDNGGYKCEKYCIIGSSKYGYCRLGQ